VQQAIDDGNIPKAKELVHKIADRALWNIMFDKIDVAKAVSA
jgi:hypothetical protein